MAVELDALLTAAAVARPFILVGHSFGGLIARVYARQHTGDVVGVVLIERLAPDSWARQGLPESTAGGVPVPLEGTRLAARLGLLRLTRFPPADPELRARAYAKVRGFQSSAKFGDLLTSLERSFKASRAQTRASGSLGDVPLLVVLGGASEASDPVARALQEEQAGLSTRSELVVVPGATHNGLVTSDSHAPETVHIVADFVSAIDGFRPAVRFFACDRSHAAYGERAILQLTTGRQSGILTAGCRPASEAKRRASIVLAGQAKPIPRQAIRRAAAVSAAGEPDHRMAAPTLPIPSTTSANHPSCTPLHPTRAPS